MAVLVAILGTGPDAAPSLGTFQGAWLLTAALAAAGALPALRLLRPTRPADVAPESPDVALVLEEV